MRSPKVLYVLVEHPNPQDRTAPKKFYASAVVRESMRLEGLAERIAGSSTTSNGILCSSLQPWANSCNN
ncbi:MAG: hypothetical protein ACRC77_08890 [Bacteroidales bacterium]